MKEMTHEEYVKELTDLYEIAKEVGDVCMANTLLEYVRYERSEKGRKA